MKKKFLTVLLAFVAALGLCFGLAACDSGNGSTAGNGSAVGGTQTEQGGGEHEHSYSNLWTSDENDHWHAATCGHTDIKDKAAHTYQNGVCSTCDHVHVNHTFGNWTEKEKPTCTVDGYQEHTCSVCGKIEQQTLTHTGHSYKNGVCSVCGSVEGLIAFRTLEVSDDDTVYGKVSNQTETFSFIQEILFADDVTFTVSYDLDGTNTIPTKTVSLEIGDNTYYVLASRGNLLKLYTVTVRRRPVYNVNFETSGSAVEPQQVEEDSEITPPAATTKRGYTFQKWTLGGTEATFPYKAEEGIPQTSGYNVTLNAVFTANDYKATLDAKGGEVAKGEQAVTFDQSYNFPVPTRTGYTFTGWYEGQNQLTNASGASLSAWTYAEGKQLDAHWSANSYKLTVEGNLSDAGTVTGGGTFAYDSDVTVTATTNKGYNFLGWYNEANERVSEQESYTFPMGLEQTITAKWDFYTVTVSRNDTAAGTLSQNYNEEKISAGEQVSITATTNLGYTFLGWYSGDTELTTDKTYSFTMKRENVTFKARWKVSPEMENFIFTSGCTITGIKDKTVTEIIVPDYASIREGAFKGCSNVESMTLPSVWAIGTTSGLEHYRFPFGYFFGTSSFSGSSRVAQSCRYKRSNGQIVTPSFYYYIPDSLKRLTITNGKIYYGAFGGCHITSITIGSNVTSIESGSFSSTLTEVHCTDLASWCKIDFEDEYANPLYYAHHLYLDGVEVKNLTIPAEITEIKPYAFYGCSGLESVTISDGVTSIGSSAFQYCSELQSVIIGSGVTSIGDHAFNDCSCLKNVIWNAKNCTLGYIEYKNYPYIFSGLTNLQTVTFGEAVERIPACAFRACRGLERIEIPDSVISIGDYAFQYCSELQSVTIGSGVTSIGGHAFEDCSGLESIFWGAENCSVASDTYELIFRGCENLKTVTFDETVKKISAYVFRGCSGLTSVTIGSGVTSIGDFAFDGCSGLTEIVIPDSVTSIGYVAFYGCSGLTSIVIPNSVTSIGSNAFGGCTRLKAVYYKGTPAEWSTIQIGSDNNVLTKATRYYFSAETPTVEQWAESQNWWHYEADGETIVLWTKEEV